MSARTPSTIAADLVSVFGSLREAFQFADRKERFARRSDRKALWEAVGIEIMKLAKAEGRS